MSKIIWCNLFVRLLIHAILGQKQYVWLFHKCSVRFNYRHLLRI